MFKDPEYYVQGVLDRNRLMLARTITLVESALATHQEMARTIIDRLLPYTRKSSTIGHYRRSGCRKKHVYRKLRNSADRKRASGGSAGN